MPDPEPEQFIYINEQRIHMDAFNAMASLMTATEMATALHCTVAQIADALITVAEMS